MDQVYLWYLGSITASPIILAGVLWLARQDMRRSILVLSALALGIGLASDLVFTLLLKSLADSQGWSTYGPISGSYDSTINLLFIQYWRNITLVVAMTMQNAAWVLALYSAIQARRGRWLALIAACATLSSFVEFFAANASAVGVAAVISLPLRPFTYLFVAHPFGTLFALNALALLASGATLLYCQIGLRTARGSGLVPGAAVLYPSGALPLVGGLPASLPVDETGYDESEDVEFVVERLPGGWGEQR